MVIADTIIYICCVLVLIVPLILIVIIQLYIHEVILAARVPYIGVEEDDNTFFYTSMWMDE